MSIILYLTMGLATACLGYVLGYVRGWNACRKFTINAVSELGDRE